jgi:hypothetical protein
MTAFLFFGEAVPKSLEQAGFALELEFNLGDEHKIDVASGERCKARDEAGIAAPQLEQYRRR